MHHKCRPGYQIIGSFVRKCLLTGEWSGNTPICIRRGLQRIMPEYDMHYHNYFVGILGNDRIQVLQCPELPNPEWGTVNITQSSRGLFVAVYKCMPEYSISGDRLRFCSPTSGQWSGSQPRCVSSKPSLLYTLYCTYHHVYHIAMVMDAYMNGVSGSGGDQNSERKKRQSSLISNIELMVFVDAGVRNEANQNGFDIIDYILGLINIVSGITIITLN